MKIYEKENAKEWQLNTSNEQPRKPTNGHSDSDSESGVAGPSAGLAHNRFAPIATATLHPRPNNDRLANQSSKPIPRTAAKPAHQAPKARVRPTPQPPRARVRPTIHRPANTSKNTPISERPKATVQPTKSSQRLPPGQVPHKPEHSKITFSNKKDNASKTAYRHGKVQNETFTFNTPWAQIELNRAKMYARLEEIGVRFGSFIRPPQFLRDRTLLIWGNEKQVAETIIELKHWTSLSDEEVRGTREKMLAKAGHDKFGKVGELIDKQDRELDRKLKRVAEMQSYQKNPVDGRQFEFQGYFLWPAKEVKPENLLGPNCEAFDPIRTYNHSHIVWEPQLSCFKILSNSEAAVQDAIQRIEGTMREYAARSSTTYAFNVVGLPEASSMQEDIKMLPGPPLNGSTQASLIPILTGRCLSGNALTAFKTEREELLLENRRKIQNSLGKMMERMPCFRGRLRMRVHFGRFILDNIRWPGGAPTISFTEFVASITNTANLTGVVTRDLQYQGAHEALIHRCTGSQGAFEPVSIAHGSVAEIVPAYTGRFTFRTPETGNVTLEVELTKRLDGVSIYYEVSKTHWTRNDPTEMDSPFDLNMVYLTGGCSWKLQVSRGTTVDETRITPRMADFESSIAYQAPPKEIRPEITGCKVFKHAFNTPYESFEQKTALRFQHKDHSAWIFEFARYDTFSPNVNTASSKAQWGASFWSTDWDNILAENDKLEIGQAAKWEPMLARFFPGSSSQTKKASGVDGFQDFLCKVQDVTNMLDEVKAVPRNP